MIGSALRPYVARTCMFLCVLALFHLPFVWGVSVPYDKGC